MRVWRLFDVWCLSDAYIGPKSRTERHRKTECWHRGSPRQWLGFGHHFQGQKVKGQLAGGGAYCVSLPHSYAPTPRVWTYKRWCASDVCLCLTSVAYRASTARPHSHWHLAGGRAYCTWRPPAQFLKQAVGGRPLKYAPLLCGRRSASRCRAYRACRRQRSSS